MPTKLRRRLDEQGSAYGVVSLLGESAVSVLVESAWDFVLLDCQHGPFDEATAADVVRRLAGAPVAVLVRVSRLDGALIGRVLDAGADGVVIPTVESAAQSAEAVAAVHFPPSGHRSFGPGRPDLPAEPAELADRADCFVMIESARGLENLRDIVHTPGISGVLVGPIDLGLALGVLPAEVIGSPVVAAAMAEIVAECDRAGVVAGSFGFSTGHAAALSAAGFSCITVGTDEQHLLAAGSSTVDALRSGSAIPSGRQAHEAVPYGRPSGVSGGNGSRARRD
jgi:2-keto-3-deoxy-L-rhamnonate aldolase RhmA